MDMWESIIKENTPPEEKMYLVDQSCNVSYKMIALQQMGHSYQEAVDELYERESSNVRGYVATGGKIKFDDSICYMYPNMERVANLNIEIDDFFYIDDKIVLSNN